VSPGEHAPTALPAGGKWCTALEQLELPDGSVVRPGEWITFNYRTYNPHRNETVERRTSGRVLELWLEEHPSLRWLGKDPSTATTFAEIEDAKGRRWRMWTHRDLPRRGTDLEAQLGPAPAEAMF
jgi:hypothetical protein